jgi:hypothetical protein
MLLCAQISSSTTCFGALASIDDALVEELPVRVNHRVGRFLWVPIGDSENDASG